MSVRFWRIVSCFHGTKGGIGSFIVNRNERMAELYPDDGQVRRRPIEALSALIVAGAFAVSLAGPAAPQPQDTLKPAAAPEAPPRDKERPGESKPKVPMEGEKKEGVIRPPEVDPAMSKSVPNVDPHMTKPPKPPKPGINPPAPPQPPAKAPDIQPR
jgi:hypothetical protein